MARDSRSRSVRRSHGTSGRGRSPRRSPRDSAPRRNPRDDSGRRTHRPDPDAVRFTPPSTWTCTSTHWDTKTEYGLNFPKRVEATQFSRRQNLAGQEITQIKLIDVVQSGLNNWGLWLVANGRFVSCDFFGIGWRLPLLLCCFVKCPNKRTPLISPSCWKHSPLQAKTYRNGTRS